MPSPAGLPAPAGRRTRPAAPAVLLAGVPALVLALVLALVVAAVLAVPAAAVPRPLPPGVGATGAGDPYFPLDGNGGYDVDRYDVHVRWAFRPRRLTGWTVVTARATRDLRAFHLDLLLPARRVRVDGRPAAFRRVRTRGGTSHELRVRPARPLAAGETFRVAVAYGGRPTDVAWWGARNLRATDDEVLAVDQPHVAPWWFPCSDHPSDKARVDVHVTVPRGRQVVAGGTLRRVTGTGGWRTWHWRGDRPTAPYLAFFAAGRFDVERGRTAGVPWVRAVSRRLPPARRAAAMRFLRQTPRVLGWLSSRLGPYPFASSGGVVTGLPLGFALETQTRPVYPEVGASELDLLVHEQAHQWFGDSVSLERWSDIWLNEGFATWAEQLWAETHGGPTAASWLRRWYDELSRDAAFWRLPVGDPGPAHLFAWEVYQRGGMAVEALRQRLGEDVFGRLVRRWLATRAGGHGTTEQLQALAERLSGEDLGAFFEAWLRAPRPPDDTPELGLG